MKLGQPSMYTLTRSASLTHYEQVARSVGLDPFRMLRLAAASQYPGRSEHHDQQRFGRLAAGRVGAPVWP